MAPLHSQGCEGAACPCLDTKLQPPEKTITNWFLFLSPPCTGYHPRYYPLGFRAGALNSHLCLGHKALVSSAQKRPRGARGDQGGQEGRPGCRPGGPGVQGGQAGSGSRQGPVSKKSARCPLVPPLEVPGSLESVGSKSLGREGAGGGARGHGSALGAEFDHTHCPSK